MVYLSRLLDADTLCAESISKTPESICCYDWWRIYP